MSAWATRSRPCSVVDLHVTQVLVVRHQVILMGPAADAGDP